MVSRNHRIGDHPTAKVPVLPVLGGVKGVGRRAKNPGVSTLNDLLGLILANAAIVPAGKDDPVDVYVLQESHVILDINGYFSAQ